MNLLNAVVLAFVEGITEFLPISSTGHMIIASSLLGINEEAFTKSYIVIIQLGAIASVVALYWRRFLTGIDFYKKLIVGFIPAAVLGFLFNKAIDRLLGDVVVVALAMIIGGLILLWIDKRLKSHVGTNQVSNRAAFVTGLFQCLAMIPGVSRSAASIVGGMLLGFDRKTSAEFSFFLAVPTMLGATVLKLLTLYKDIQPEQISILLIGNFFAFIVAGLSIKFFIGYLSKHGFKIFGYYRIFVGALILILIYGFDLNISNF